MQQFTVPQFIDVEDKVIGFITVRQFIILLVAALIIAILYKLLYFETFIISAVIVAFIAIIVAFAKINGVNFHIFFTNFLITLFKPNVRVWNNAFGKDYVKIVAEKVVEDSKEPEVIKTYSSSRLTELSMIVDTQGVFKGTETPEDQNVDYKKTLHSRN
ncbi:hypothetical protein C0583_00920 [Candidatus Parcubacteria bacterium]|nr:MAG: hypothetical protein C0583_00920 [Candidatus Parcubacteria bacterium]